MKMVPLDLEPAFEPLELAELGPHSPITLSRGADAPSSLPLWLRGRNWAPPFSLLSAILGACHLHPTLFFLGVPQVSDLLSKFLGASSGCPWQKAGIGALSLELGWVLPVKPTTFRAGDDSIYPPHYMNNKVEDLRFCSGCNPAVAHHALPLGECHSCRWWLPSLVAVAEPTLPTPAATRPVWA